jgi:GNAT superfamily N-acetyltransferase
MSDKAEAIEIRMMRPEEEPDLLAFMKANLDTWDKFEKLWKWRQDLREISGGETAAIAKKDGKIVGCVGIVPAAVTVKGHRINASWQQDSLVSPAMRGKGLGKSVVNKAAEGWNMAMAKGTSGPMYGLRRKLGFRDVPNSDYLVRVNKVRTQYSKFRDRVAESLLICWKTLLPLPKGNLSLEIKRVASFDKTFDRLAEQLSNERVLRLHKGQAYLNWRYFQCPGKQYKVFRAGETHTMGAIVLSISGAKADEGWIVDLICSSRDKGTGYALLNKAMRHFEDQNVCRIWAFATLPAARKWLFRFGFLPTNRTPRFTYKVIRNDCEQIGIYRVSWDFWHCDGDIELYM